MKGSYQIKVSNKRIKYDFTIHRNITIIQGDSATGKTTLIKLINDYYNEGTSSGVKLSCQKDCVVLRGRNWETDLSVIKDSIVFIDEGSKFVTSKDFAKAVKNSDNYYIIITREDLHILPYSVNEIYGIQKTGKTVTNAPTYNSLYRLYGEINPTTTLSPTTLITEDSNSGFDFFQTVCKNNGLSCISAKGKNQIIRYIYNRPNETVLIIADGAAYGSEMRETMQYIKQFSNYALYLPESFEWLILKSGIFRNNELTAILTNPSNYIESKEFFSWERFFTYLLEHVTQESILVPKYSKISVLSGFYKRKGNIEKILNQMENIQL